MEIRLQGGHWTNERMKKVYSTESAGKQEYSEYGAATQTQMARKHFETWQTATGYDEKEDVWQSNTKTNAPANA